MSQSRKQFTSHPPINHTQSLHHHHHQNSPRQRAKSSPANSVKSSHSPRSSVSSNASSHRGHHQSHNSQHGHLPPPSLPHFRAQRSAEPPSTSHKALKSLTKSKSNNNLLSNHQQNGNENESENEGVFRSVELDVKRYTERFLSEAMNRGWYANEYSATLDEIASTPLSPAELLEVHRIAYCATIGNDSVRSTDRRHIHLVDARIGATADRVYNGVYGVYQVFMAKNNQISFIFNDRIITDKLSHCHTAQFVVEHKGDRSEWDKYRADLMQQISTELLGPYKSWSLYKFEKTLNREFRAYSVLFAAATTTSTAGSGSKTESESTLKRREEGDGETESDCKSMDGDTAWQRLTECHKSLKSELLRDTKQWTQRNDEMKEALSAEDGAQRIRAKAVALEIERYVRSANELLTAQNEAVSTMRRCVETLRDATKRSAGKAMVSEVVSMQSELKGLILAGKGVMDWKFECLSFNEQMVRIKKEFHGKNKRFKKEIKDRISNLKQLDLDDIDRSDSKRRTVGARIATMIRFCSHNLKGGTMAVLQAMLLRVRSLTPPQNEHHLTLQPVFDCVAVHQSVAADLAKQVDLCRKLLAKLQEFAVRKERKWTAFAREKGDKLGGGGGAANGGDGGNGDHDDDDDDGDDGVHCDDVIFRNNDSGRYEKAFLAVVWAQKVYRVYDSAMSYQSGRAPILEESFRATDYGYNGHLSVEVQRSRTSKKTSSFKGYQFILAKHAFLVEDMLQIKYWRNYIQRGQNMRKLSSDWKANTMSSPQRTANNKGIRLNAQNHSDNDAINDHHSSSSSRDRLRTRYKRNSAKTRSSSLV